MKRDRVYEVSLEALIDDVWTFDFSHVAVRASSLREALDVAEAAEGELTDGVMAVRAESATLICVIDA